MLKDFLIYKGVKVYLPRDVIKEAFSYDVIPAGQIWMDMLDARNLTSQEYNMDKIDIIIKSVASCYYNELSRFKNQIEDFHE